MLLTIIAHPGSKKPRIERDPDGTYHVYVRAKAHDGEANAAIIEALSTELSRPKNSLSILRGHTAKRKLFSIVS